MRVCRNIGVVMLAGALAVSLGTFERPLRSQPANYPGRPISLVVPLGAGSSADQVARLIAGGLSERLRQPVVIENRAGAGTIVGATLVARAPPDGHTLLFAPSGTLAINPALYRKLPYDPVGDFVPIVQTTNVPLVLVAGLSTFASLPAMITQARRAPSTLVIASSGIGTANHLAAELLQEAAGITLIHAPYRDSASALRDVVAGHVQLMFSDAGAALSLIKDNKIRAFGLSTRQPLPSMPGIPSLASLGVGVDAGSWHMLLGPSGMPGPIVSQLNREVTNLLGNPAMRSQVESLGLTVAAPEDALRLPAFVDGERQRWRLILQRLGLVGTQ